LLLLGRHFDVHLKGNAMEYAQMNQAPSNVQEMPGSAEDTLRNVRAVMDEYMAGATEKAREAAAYADRTVQQNPWTAVGVGFGVGMVFGAMVALLAAKSQQSTFDRLR
jgi:ElaB/YqjD/DUF883 family membrane-anchored ribosome-binding protein